MYDDNDDVAAASLLCPASQSSPKECGETEVLMMIIWACLGRAFGTTGREGPYPKGQVQ